MYLVQFISTVYVLYTGYINLIDSYIWNMSNILTNPYASKNNDIFLLLESFDEKAEERYSHF